MIVATLLRAWRVGTEATHAIKAAEEVLAAGGDPLAALRAFAAATHGELDDQAVQVLEDALRRAVKALHQVTTVAAWLYERQDEAVKVFDAVLNLGYRAAGWRAKLGALLEDQEPAPVPRS